MIHSRLHGFAKLVHNQVRNKHNNFRNLITLSLLTIFLQHAACVELEIFYWGDFHAQNTPSELTIDGVTQKVGGAAAFSGLLKSLRQKNRRILTFDAGDQFTGQPISSLTRGKSQITLLNKLKVDAFVPGNHEFDHGWHSLIEVTRKADFDILLANVRISADSSDLFPPHSIYQLDGLSVAVIGLIYDNFMGSVIHNGIIGLEVTDPILTAQNFVDVFKDSVDLLVALTHNGWSNDSTLAARVRGLDLIIGGHSHTVLEQPRIINNVIISHTGSHGRYIGHLTLNVDITANSIIGYEAELIPVLTDSIKADRKVARLISKYTKKHTKTLDRNIGTLASNWNSSKHDQSNMAQWFVDAMRGILPRTDLAVINNGNLRKNLGRGPIKVRDVWEICPFENSIIVFQISGIELINAVYHLIDSPREFMTWSGLKVVSDSGEVRSIMVNNLPVHPKNEYSVIATGYVRDHIKSYLDIPQDFTSRPFFFIPGNQRDFMIEAVETEKVISSGLDDRWLVK